MTAARSRMGTGSIGASFLVAAAILLLPAGTAQGNEKGEFTAASYKAIISGSSNAHEFTAAGGSAKCAHTTVVSTWSETATSQFFQAQYEECTAFGFVGATVSMNGCNYLYRLTGTGGVPGTYNSTMDIVCALGKEITINAGHCVVHIPPQNGLKAVTFTNEGNNLVMHSNITGIEGTLTKNTFLCFHAAGKFTNGATTGSFLLAGADLGGEPIKIDIG